MGKIINQVSQDAFELMVRGSQMTLVRKPDHWEMWTKNASTQAYNNGFPSLKIFGSLEEVEDNYKTWKGISQLIEEPRKTTQN